MKTLSDVAKPTTCRECGKYFTSVGLKMHEGSWKCKINQAVKPFEKEVNKEIGRLTRAGKHSIMTNVAKALENRGLADVCGLELALTKLFVTDIECKILEQYWVYSWVYSIWEHYKEEGYTVKAYKILEQLNKMTEVERKSEISLIILGMHGRF